MIELLINGLCMAIGIIIGRTCTETQAGNHDS